MRATDPGTVHPKGGAGPMAQRVVTRNAWVFRGLTFELSWRQRWATRARWAKMYRVPPTGPAWPAVGAQLERGVRPRCTSVARALVKWRRSFSAVQAEQTARTEFGCLENRIGV